MLFRLEGVAILFKIRKKKQNKKGISVAAVGTK
jgi:hypothetical protein